METVTFRRILMPTDFSDLAGMAIPWAKAIAGRSGAEIEVIYADPFLPPPYFTAAHLEEAVAQLSRSRELAEDELERYVAEEFGDGFTARAAVVESLPVQAIAEWSERNETDLIIMGTHGRSGIDRMMLGSVTEHVLRETSRPLLAIRAQEGTEARASEAVEIRRILCPVNFTRVAQRALEYAGGLAELFQAELTVVHVTEEKSGLDATSEIDRCVVEAGQGANVRKVLLQGDADEQVIEFARANAIDLIVLGAQHRRFGDASVLGETTVHVIRHAPAAVLTVIGRE